MLEIDKQVTNLEVEETIEEKITSAQTEVDGLLGLMSSSSVSFSEFKLHSEQAHALADDILLVLEPIVIPQIETNLEIEQPTSTEEVLELPETATTTEQVSTSSSIVEEIPLPIETDRGSTTATS
jgi:hypothetical protein